MQKQWHNLTTILKYSNATPFKDRNDAGYICAYCFKTYPDPNVLRQHTHYDHDKEKPTYKAGSGMSSFVAFLDIVDLKCTICDQNMESINVLTEHLVNQHDKKYYLGVTDYFQPFKLTSEPVINCCLCNEIFHNMKLLMQHMNKHYRNFICTICGAGFVNSFRLNRHETTHGKKKSSFTCRHCGQVFAAESKKKAHVNTEHKGIAGDSVCQICKARFKNYYQKTRHMMQVHNVEGIKCDMCDKSDQVEVFNSVLFFVGVEKETSYIEITIKQEPASDSEQQDTEFETVIKIEKESDEKESKKVIKGEKKSAADKKSKKDQILEMEKHLKNISTILLHTNATPIRYHDGANYVCALCPETYPLPSELKLHVLEEHDQIDKSSFMEGHRLTSYVVKLDITNLRCLICHSEIEGFDHLFEHLNTVHGKGLHTDIPNHILPFRFVGNGFDCVQCPKSFEHFKLIQEHMSVHYGNYLCETCNSRFVNKRTMQNHANRHKKGDFPCSQCAKIFDTNRKKLNHEKFVHAGDYKRKKCPYCQEKFTNYAKKRSHMVKEHGAEPLSVKCDICKKTFSTRARLRGHTRRDHMECQHACTECEMRFFTKMELVKHMVKHSPLREYQCDICQKAYARKHTLREHLKIHANIRNFKCELCAYTFVQKCSWKTHMRNKHKVKVP
ncbi:unnamed protein product [Euphydryas editha]|uniref:C2H2-type domain-containing protein n=1 Tax=Euphydryas editha TaxID=104508 RepID=A0AAU9ULR6_EUPED|nr:unnamed protein product [Euphydryas editha]